jgi:hypothetical protein
MNTSARTTAMAIHTRLRVIAGIRISLLARRGANTDIHTRPDCPPKVAAAAESRISTGPTGFRAPAMQESIPAVK